MTRWEINCLKIKANPYNVVHVAFTVLCKLPISMVAIIILISYKKECVL